MFGVNLDLGVSYIGASNISLPTNTLLLNPPLDIVFSKHRRYLKSPRCFRLHAASNKSIIDQNIQNRYLRISRGEDLVVAVLSRLSVMIVSNQMSKGSWNWTITWSGKRHANSFYYNNFSNDRLGKHRFGPCKHNAGRSLIIICVRFVWKNVNVSCFIIHPSKLNANKSSAQISSCLNTLSKKQICESDRALVKCLHWYCKFDIINYKHIGRKI